MQVGEGAATAQIEVEEIKEQEKEHVTIRCSVFFDGTLNNRDNTIARIDDTPGYQQNKVEEKDNSYENNLTNVAKMELQIDKSSETDLSTSVYIEGPGTEAVVENEKGEKEHKPDAMMGYAFGTMGTGVKEKVRLGIIKATQKILKSCKGKKYIIDKLVIDVFGFSRGAAGARCFVHEVLNEEPKIIPTRYQTIKIHANPLFLRISRDGHEITADKVEFKFVGVYDTVASYGVPHWSDGTELLNLDYLKHEAVKKVVHLVASDEHRANFPLTNIKSAGSKGTEIYLPGVHSDLGGSYLVLSNEGSHDEPKVINRAYKKSTLEKDRDELIQQGWYRESEVSIRDASFTARYLSGVVGHLATHKPAQHHLCVVREDIEHHYDRIPLNIMADFAQKEGIKLKGKFKKVSKVPGKLTEQFDALKSYAQGSSKLSDWFEQSTPSWLPALRHGYFHFSADYKRTLKLVAPNKPNFENDKRVRGVHEG